MSCYRALRETTVFINVAKITGKSHPEGEFRGNLNEGVFDGNYSFYVVFSSRVDLG